MTVIHLPTPPDDERRALIKAEADHVFYGVLRMMNRMEDRLGPMPQAVRSAAVSLQWEMTQWEKQLLRGKS